MEVSVRTVGEEINDDGASRETPGVARPANELPRKSRERETEAGTTGGNRGSGNRCEQVGPSQGGEEGLESAAFPE